MRFVSKVLPRSASKSFQNRASPADDEQDEEADHEEQVEVEVHPAKPDVHEVRDPERLRVRDIPPRARSAVRTGGRWVECGAFFSRINSLP